MTSLSVEQEKNSCQVSGSSQVKLYPDLNKAGIKSGQLKELALWYCLRALDTIGNGELKLDEALDGLSTTFHYRHNTLAKHLNMGEGVLWHRWVANRGCRIKIYALKEAYRYFTIPKIDSHPRVIPAGEFCGYKARNAVIYATIFRPEGIQANPISRQTITELTGLHKMQQRRYEKAARVKRTPNFAMVADRDSQGHITAVRPVIITVNSKSKQTAIRHRLGNTYHSRAVSAPKGILRKVKTAKSKESFISDEVSLMRRFWTSLRRYSKALGHKSRAVWEPSLVILPNKHRMIKNRLEWGYVTV